MARMADLRVGRTYAGQDLLGGGTNVNGRGAAQRLNRRYTVLEKDIEQGRYQNKGVRVRYEVRRRDGSWLDKGEHIVNTYEIGDWYERAEHERNALEPVIRERLDTEDLKATANRRIEESLVSRGLMLGGILLTERPATIEALLDLAEILEDHFVRHDALAT